MDFELTKDTTLLSVKARKNAARLHFLCMTLHSMKCFFHAQGLKEHTESQFSKWVKTLGKNILLSSKAPPKRGKK